MADVSITNVGDLKAEIIRLRQLKSEQGAAIQARFSSPSAIFHTFGSLFPKSAGGKNGIFNQDIFGLLSRILLPLTLNKTIFRNSNFIVKALVGYLSQKASHFVNEDKVMGIWDKVMSVFEKKKPVDYGIPPESEAS
ncbi:hypothetical protein ACPPVU_01350 [Mucilaginibacter sp. McL0603]|uniref:hypothetical protein n=1 Tax=Mucilaginibacter sp. McL0603 TaxID=3415670 RepID=UPI003CF1C731